MYILFVYSIYINIAFAHICVYIYVYISFCIYSMYIYSLAQLSIYIVVISRYISHVAYLIGCAQAGHVYRAYMIS